MCHPDYGKEISQDLIMFSLSVWWGEEKKSACFMSQWRVGSVCNDVKRYMRQWGDALSWGTGGAGNVHHRNTFLCDLCQGDSGMWDVGTLSYISQNSSLWSDWPLWHWEAEIYIKKMGFLWRISLNSRKETRDASVTWMWSTEHSSGSAGSWCARGVSGENTPITEHTLSTDHDSGPS